MYLCSHFICSKMEVQLGSLTLQAWQSYACYDLNNPVHSSGVYFALDSGFYTAVCGGMQVHE